MSLLDGLLHWWELDTTAWLDSHGSWNLTGRRDSGGAFPSINATGGPDGGPCLVLDGTNYLDRTDVAWDGSGAARSIQIWGYYTSLSTTGNWLISHRSVATETVLHQLSFSTPLSGAARASFSDGTTFISFGANPESSGAWHHLLLSTNSTNRHRLYVDGELDDESTTAINQTTPAGSVPFAIGVGSWNKTGTTLRHRGLACLAAVWEREVSESEAVKLYNSGAGLRYAALDATGSSGAKIARLRRAHAGIRGMRA